MLLRGEKWLNKIKYSQPAEQGHVLTETRVGQPHQGRVHHRSAIKHKNYTQPPKMATQPRCADCHSKSLEDLYCRSQTNTPAALQGATESVSEGKQSRLSTLCY